MADRSVSVKLLADVRGFVSGVQRANAESKKMAGDLAKHAADNSQAYDKVGKSLVGIGLAAGAGVGAAVSAFAKFDAQMSAAAAAAGVTGSALDGLRNAAIQAGADTVFSASEAAQGIENLAKAGVAAEDIMGGGLTGALDLAAAGELGVGEAAEIAASAMTQFGLEGEDVTHIADLLAAGAGKAQGSVQDMGAALNQVGLIANSTGLTIEETTGGLAAFASAGLTGSDAGTSFKTMLQALNPKSEEASRVMKEMGISAYDAQGNFVGLSAFAGNLQESLADLTPEARNSALAVIFGSDAVRAANVLYEQGAAGVESWTAKVNDSGFAAEQAAARLDNLKGDIEAFTGSVETAFIGLGASSNGPLRELVQDATTAVNVLSDIPAPAQAAALGVGALTAGATLLGGSLLIVLPKLQAGVVSLAAMGPAGAKAAAGFRAVGASAGPISLILTGIAVAGGVALNAYIDQKQAVDDYAASLDQLTGALTDASREAVKKALDDKGALEAAERLGLSTNDLVDAILNGGDAFDAYVSKLDSASSANSSLNAAQQATSGLANQTSQDIYLLRDALGEETGALADATEAVQRKARADIESGDASSKASIEHAEAAGAITSMGEAAGNSTGATEDLAAATESAAAEALTFEEQVDALNSALDSLFGQAMSVQEAADNTAQGFADMAEEAKKSREDGVAPLTESIYAQTQAGRDHRDQLDAMIRTIGDEASALAENGATLSEVTSKTNASREALILQAMEWGYTREEAEAYTDSLGKVPDTVATTIGQPGMEQAKLNALALKAALDNIPKSVRVDISTYATTIRQDIAMADRGGTQPRLPPSNMSTSRDGRAMGGYITGPGTGTSDSIPIWASNGEYMLPKRMVDAIGVRQLDAMRRGYASGGLVGARPMASSAYGMPSTQPISVNVSGAASRQGLTVAAGAIQVNGAGSPIRTADEVLYKMRVAAATRKL